MKKKTIVRRMVQIVTVAALLGLLAGCGDKASSPQASGDAPANPASSASGVSPSITRPLRLSLAVAEDHMITKSLHRAADEIKASTGLDIQIFSAGSLGAEADTFDMVRSGDIDFWCGGVQTVTTKPVAEEVSGTLFPFTFDTREHAESFHEEYLMPEVLNSDEYKKELNLHFISIYNQGARQLTTTDTAVYSPADLAGKKIRSMEQDVAIATVKGLGGSPMPVSFNELYLALQTGVVDGQENPYNNIEAMKFYEVQEYIIKTSHQYTFSPLVMNNDVWQALTAEEQDALVAAFVKVQKECNEEAVALLETEEALFKEHGITVIEEKDLDMDAFRANADKVIKESFSDAKYDSWREMHDKALEWCATH